MATHAGGILSEIANFATAITLNTAHPARSNFFLLALSQFAWEIRM